MNKKNREHGVYKYVYKGEVVYIGKTDAENGFRNRINAHKKEHELFNKSDIYVYKCKDKTETDSLETILINTYKPILNKMKLYDYEIEAPKLNWINWKIYSNKNKIVSLKDTLFEVNSEDNNCFCTIGGYNFYCYEIIPRVEDIITDAVIFRNNGSIREGSIGHFPTKESLLNMQNHIENMLRNYDVFLEEFKEYQIHSIRKAAKNQGYVLDVDIENFN